MTFKHLIIPSLLAITMAACSPSGTKESSTDTIKPSETTISTASAAPELGSFGVDIEAMDETVKPGDNFFKYVNGGWMERTEIPADKSNYGSFNKLGDRSEQQVRAIIEEAAGANASNGSPEQKIGDLYAAFMDTDAIEANGLAPIKDDLATIDSLHTHEDIGEALGVPGLSLSGPVGGFITVDYKDVQNYAVYLTQSGLGMPNRDYYFDEGDKADGLRAAYKDYITTILTALGKDNAAARADAIYDYEAQLAQVHWTPTKRRKRDLTYNKMTLEELEDFAPGFPWTAYMKAGGVNEDAVVVRETDALQASAKIFADTPTSVLQDYMAFHYVSDMASYLPKEFDKARFEFYSKKLRGTEVQRDRWKRGVSQVSRTLGEAIGQVYVEKHFPADSKRQMVDLVENLRGAFKDGIDNLEWMSEDTKVEAQDKLRKFNPKIGYPDKWTDYSKLKVNRDDLIGTVKSANVWAHKKEVSKLGGPIDRDEWGMTPQTVNAYYNPGLNEIVFPAAILQAPFFDPNADPAVNYGGIGAVIGHEMGHGFDDQGSKSDGNGEQRNWWTEEDLAAFKARTNTLVAQFNEFEALPGLFVNGELTLGENIGDLTGITMAYAAYKRSLGGKDAPTIDGLTGDQRFFLSYGQIWQRKFRDEALRNRIKSDPHSPGEYRANGIVRNFDAWYEAFNVQPGDALYLPPEKRVKIW